jgi:hypothetical protein
MKNMEIYKLNIHFCLIAQFGNTKFRNEIFGNTKFRNEIFGNKKFGNETLIKEHFKYEKFEE